MMFTGIKKHYPTGTLFTRTECNTKACDCKRRLIVGCFFFFFLMTFIKFRVIDKFEGFDPEHFLVGYNFEIQVAKQEKQKGILHRWKKEKKKECQTTLKIALYTGHLKKTFCLFLNPFCILSWCSSTILENWAQKPQIKVRS